MLLNESGYYSFQDNKFYFYLKDHQGNIRVVADEDGKVEEVNDYYPFGGLMFNAGDDTQPYKYNGKELDQKGWIGTIMGQGIMMRRLDVGMRWIRW